MCLSTLNPLSRSAEATTKINTGRRCLPSLLLDLSSVFITMLIASHWEKVFDNTVMPVVIASIRACYKGRVSLRSVLRTPFRLAKILPTL